MVYKRRHHGRRFTRRRGHGKSKLTHAVVTKLVGMAKRDVTNFKYIVNNGQAFSTLVNATPYSYVLNGIVEGTDETNRVGDRARNMWLDLKFQLYSSSPANTTMNVRVVIVKEKTCLGSAPSYSQIFNSATPYTIANRNFTTRDERRFKIYYDRTFTLCPEALTLNPTTNSLQTVWASSGHESSIITRHVRRKLGFVTDYSRGNAGTVADIDTNSLSILIFTDNTTAGIIGGAIQHVICFSDH